MIDMSINGVKKYQDYLLALAIGYKLEPQVLKRKAKDDKKA